MSFDSIFFPLLFLIGAVSLTCITKSFQSLGRVRTKREFYKKQKHFFYYFFIRKIFPKDVWGSLYFIISFSKQILRILYAATAFLTLIHIFDKAYVSFGLTLYWASIIIALLTLFGLLIDFSFRLLASYNPLFFLKYIMPFGSLFLCLFSILTFPMLKLQKLLFPSQKNLKSESRVNVKERILEFVHETELSKHLDHHDQKLITSIASFRDRIAKEVMVPRVDIYSLSINQTVHKAAEKLITEGYSRIPVYKDTIDNIVGVLLLKDVMHYYIEAHRKNTPTLLNTPLETLITPVIYAPETKKISHLLQEFKVKKIHLAIVVDEYGGTEGIVTIEDILEELVGEISDEYDIDEETLFVEEADSKYIIDAKMNLYDIENQIGISLPKSPEYDTLGGFIYHKAGTIPKIGWKLLQDTFELEVIRCSNRAIEKIRIIKK